MIIIIIEAHNQFARPEPFFHDSNVRKSKQTKEAHHFIAYIPHNGLVYE